MSTEAPNSINPTCLRTQRRSSPLPWSDHPWDPRWPRGEPRGSGRVSLSCPPPCVAGFRREPGDDRPRVGSARGLPGRPRRLRQGAAGERRAGESRGCGRPDHGCSPHQRGCGMGCPPGRARLRTDGSILGRTGGK